MPPLAKRRLYPIKLVRVAELCPSINVVPLAATINCKGVGGVVAEIDAIVPALVTISWAFSPHIPHRAIR